MTRRTERGYRDRAGQPTGSVALRKEVKHRGTRPHCVDHKFVPTIEDQNDCLKQATVSVETEPKLPGRVVFFEIPNPQSPGRGLNGVLGFDPVFQCGLVLSRFRQRLANHFGSGLALTCSTLIQVRNFFHCEPECDNLRWPGSTTGSPSAAPLQVFDVVAGLSLGCPGGNLLVGDGHPVDCFALTHGIYVIRKYEFHKAFASR